VLETTGEDVEAGAGGLELVVTAAEVTGAGGRVEEMVTHLPEMVRGEQLVRAWEFTPH
jgi:hypothetical protein